jgi:hypothetical protein
MQKIPLTFLVLVLCLPLILVGQYSEQHLLNSDPTKITRILDLDVDSDGQMDVVVLSDDGRELSWIRNIDGNSFANAAVIHYHSSIFNRLVSGDFDQDGAMDIVLSAYEGTYLAHNLGNGEFELEQILVNQESAVSNLVVVDYDGDGNLDLAGVLSDADAIAWFENDGQGSFEDGVVILEDGGEYCCGTPAFEDIDSDGDLDVIYETGSGANADIRWLENNGDNTYLEYQVIFTGVNVHQFLFCDVDGDEDLDLLFEGILSGDNDIYLQINDGTGEFDEAESIFDSAWQTITFFGIIDKDQDDDWDVYFIVEGWTDFLVNVNGNFYNDETIGPSYQSHSVVADFNLDGYSDLMSASWTHSTITPFYSNGDDDFIIGDYASQAIDQPAAVATGDIDQDGDEDIIAISNYDAMLVWFENLGDGQFNPDFHPIYSGNSYNTEVETHDVNGDGLCDIILGHNLNGTIMLFYNLGNAVFGDPISLTSVYQVQDIIVDDFDGDSEADLMVLHGNNTSARVGWHKNLGNGEFGSLNAIDNDLDNTEFLNAGDLTGNGLPDLFICNDWSDNFLWAENLGDGEFAEFIELASGIWQCNGTVIDDMDGDGDNDILVIGEVADNVRLIENLGDGVLADPVIIADIYAPGYIITADYDSDDDLDILVGTLYGPQYGSHITMLENLGSNQFGDPTLLTADVDRVTCLVAVDLDSDGDPDVVSSSLYDDRVAWHELTFGEGCTDPDACNYSNEAIFDDGSCFYEPCVNIADSDMDGVITISDLLDLLGSLGCEGTDCFGDLNGDSVVNIFDLLIILGWMGQEWP